VGDALGVRVATKCDESDTKGKGTSWHPTCETVVCDATCFLLLQVLLGQATSYPECPPRSRRMLPVYGSGTGCPCS